MSDEAKPSVPAVSPVPDEHVRSALSLSGRAMSAPSKAATTTASTTTTTTATTTAPAKTPAVDPPATNSLATGSADAASTDSKRRKRRGSNPFLNASQHNRNSLPITAGVTSRPRARVFSTSPRPGTAVQDDVLDFFQMPDTPDPAPSPPPPRETRTPHTDAAFNEAEMFFVYDPSTPSDTALTTTAPQLRGRRSGSAERSACPASVASDKALETINDGRPIQAPIITARQPARRPRRSSSDDKVSPAHKRHHRHRRSHRRLSNESGYRKSGSDEYDTEAESKLSSGSSSYADYDDDHNSSDDYYGDDSASCDSGVDGASRMYKQELRRGNKDFVAAEGPRVGRLDQLFAVVSRQAQQMFRQPCSLVMEVIVPLIFVAVVIVLWAVWGGTQYPETIFIPAASPSLSYYATPEAFNMCVNTSAYPGAIGNLPPCQGVDYDYVCDGDFAAIPFPAHSICRNVQTPFSSIVYAYVASLVGDVSRVPSLDTIMTYQMAAQLDITYLSQLGATSVSKLYPMTVFNAIVSSGTLYFVGDKTFIAALMAHMTSVSNLFPSFSDTVIYSSVAEARSYAPIGSMTWAIVEVKSADVDGLDLVLHMNNSALPSFGIIDDPAYPGGAATETAELYLASGFNTLQQTITEFYLTYFGIFNATQTQMMASFNYPPYVRVPLLMAPRDLLPLIFGIAYLYTVSQQTKRIVLEKELRIREATLIMGLKQWTLYVSDFIIQLVILVVIALISAVLLKISFVYKGDILILFLIFFLFSLTIIPLSGIIAAFFSKARLASLIAPVIYFILVIPMFAMTNPHGGIVIGFSVFSPTAFCAALKIFLTHEVGSGFGSGQFHSFHDDPTMAVVLGMLTADFFIYYLLMLYLDAVVPKEWGTPKHPLFFILDPIHWCCGTKAKRLEGGADGRAENGVFETTDYRGDVVSFEGLRKEYSRGGKKFVAVNNLYWGMREGEISVLLGHNGAGKTTVLNMMTGMTQPDAGDCYIYGHSVRMEKDAVRQQIGYCPQHNILWDELTCRDHLEFYGKIKGLKGWELEDAICRMLYETDLLEKMDQPAGSLSGGMKRKLSIAVAFVGGSRLVFLDEPTAGLDVAARRYVWELLQRMSQRHSILLTTHYMDEADLLGSRIGIMSQGRLKCTGSSLFLKSRLGVGYNIVISIKPELDPKVIDRFVFGSVEGSTLQGRNGTELTYLLPTSSVDQFPAFLNEIDSLEGGDIRGYSLAATTLEEVFLKVSEEDLHQHKKVISHDTMKRIWKCTRAKSVWQMQLKSTLAKRLWCSLRDRRMQCFQIVCPVLCILIAMLLTLIKFGVPSELVLTYDMFTEPKTPVLLTAGCDELLGPHSTPSGAVRNETHFMTGGMLSNYTLDTWYVHTSPRFGGISCTDRSLTAPYVTTDVNNIHFVNTTSHHQGGLALASYYDQLVKHVKGPNSFIRHTAAFLEKADATSAMNSIFVGTLIMIPMCFLPSNAVAWVVKERECGSRHLQKLSGLNFYVYWISNYIFDMVAYLISMCLCILIFAIFSREEFIGNSRVGACFTLFLLYGFTSTVMAYAVSFLFKKHATAQTMVMAVGLIIGFLLNVIVFVLQLRSDAYDFSNNIRFFFRIFPSYSIGEGVINLLMLDGNIALGNARGPWDMGQLGWAMIYCAVEIPVFWIITLVADHPELGLLCQRRQYRSECEPVIPDDEDPDVAEERNGVYSAQNSAAAPTDVVRVVDLQKRYSKKNLAVKGITFSLFPGEVFGFLGTNGAGKTTTISMLCQQFLPTGGSAYVCGYDVVKQSKEALQCIGYCPQFDATLDLLTVEEQLQLYAGIRGIEKAQWEELIDALCTLCELTMYRKTVTNELSGGNRRKLSVAMSLVGGPQVLFLDEPSAGMDPVARRGMWTAIQRASRHCSVVLTTHHLEEVEALADIVAIMVRGYIRCIGDKVHLKNKFGSAFEVSVRIASPVFAGRVIKFFEEEFPEAVQNESDGSRFVFRLTRDRGFGDIFAVLQANKEQLHITDYSVSQTSIEQVFLRVTEGSAHL